MNQMNAELETSVRAFRSQAGEVASLDATLRASGTALGKLDAQYQAARGRQLGLGQSLDDIEAEQAALSGLLDQYEAHLHAAQRGRPFGNQGLASSLADVDAGLANAERERAYVLSIPSETSFLGNLLWDIFFRTEGCLVGRHEASRSGLDLDFASPFHHPIVAPFFGGGSVHIFMLMRWYPSHL